MLHSLFIAALVLGPIGPGLDAGAILEIISPVALILSTVDMYVNAVAICLIVFPETFIDISIGMPEFTLAVRFVEAPLALVFGAIWPNLSSWAVTGAIFEVSTVDCAVFKDKLFDEGEAFFVCLSL